MNNIKNMFKKSAIFRTLNEKIKMPIYQYRMQKRGYQMLNGVFDTIPDSYKPFVDYGTMLGFIRDKGFISHDIDTDIGIICDDIEERKKLLSIFQSESYFITHEFYYLNGLQEFSIEKEGIKTDIIFYGTKTVKAELKMYTYSFSRLFNKEYKNDLEIDVFYYEYTYLNELTTSKVKSFDYPIPQNYEVALQERYGENWKVKDSNWDYQDDPSFRKLEDLGYYYNHKRKNYH